MRVSGDGICEGHEVKLSRALRGHDLGPFGNGRSRIAALALFAVAAGRAAVELAKARLALATVSMRDIAARNEAAARLAGRCPLEDAVLVARVAFVVPRVANRLPWRSDCLPQALAAQNWLRSKGVSTRLEIGVERPGGGALGAHAWLRHGKTIVTGGAIDRYDLIYGAEAAREISLP